MHVGISGDTTFNYSIRDEGFIQVKKAQVKSDFERLRQGYNEDFNYTDTYGFIEPVYYIDRERMYIAPDFDSGTEVEITFKQSEAEIGTYQLAVNNDYEPINSADQTLAEWVADGNDAADFVQEEIFIDTNLWLRQNPFLLKYGALTAAEAYVNDPNQIQTWAKLYDSALQETIDEFWRYETQQPTNQRMSSAYSF